MAAPNRDNKSKITRTTQYVDNSSFDEEFDVSVVMPVEWDGDETLYRPQSKNMATKVTTSGNDTYVAKAPIGTAQATAGWQVKKVSVSGADTVITWADGNANFDNVATDLTSLSYS